MRCKKAQIWISAVMYIVIISTALLLVLKVGIPQINSMKDKTAFEKNKDLMMQLDNEILKVAASGEGTQKVLSLDITEGKLMVDNNNLIWEFNTDADIIEDRASNKIGNLKILSNANVKTIEKADSYVLSTIADYDKDGNPVYFSAEFKKLGDKSNYVPLNTSDIIKNLTYDNRNSKGKFNMYLNNDPATGIGTGYTIMEPSANNTDLGEASIIVHVNSTIDSKNIEYDIRLTLKSYSDFLIIETKNLQIS